MTRPFWISVLLCCMAAGCVTTGSHRHECEDDDDSVNINPLIGAIGMAVDGDDKDDYESFFDSKCDCGRCRKCR